MNDAEIALPGGRTVGYADYGSPEHTAVLWCHGGPGSRLEPLAGAEDARKAGYRFIGIDRPGYGRSTPQSNRTIGGWTPDALAVADHLGIQEFAVVGVSTGGAYALALAANAADRVLGVVACCALTDMRWREGRAMMTEPLNAGIWKAGGRDKALALATTLLGEDGSKMFAQQGAPLAPADMKLLADPAWLTAMGSGMREMFAHGVVGYVDDRLADGPGWGTFDVAHIRCPVVVLHGGADTIVPVAQARHTARIVPGARLRIHDTEGHLSVIGKVVEALEELGRR
jgi:pimeloyl-ACP methyl ester carboxylesterase